MLVSPLGDSAVVVRLGDGVDAESSRRIRAVALEIERDPLPLMVDVVPAFSSVAVFFRRPYDDFERIQRDISARISRTAAGPTPSSARTVEIPVCYGGEFGPDLEVVAQHSKLTVDQVVTAHVGGTYVVDALGFLPGFPYLRGLPAALATPRRATPRAQVPAGSVGIGGAQTGVYPIASPGGWNLIGRTPLRLFDVARAEAALVRAGDEVRFVAVSPDAFAQLAAEDVRNGAPPGPGADAEPVPELEANVERDATAIAVLKPGMLSTVQDLGRMGQRAAGVPLSGAADAFALRVANLLVGNNEEAAGLEFTLIGPDLEFRTGAWVALGGGDFGLPRWRPFRVEAGERLHFGAARSGCRGYLAIAGGIAVARVLGSRSTYVRASLGGIAGRALREGDLLPFTPVNRRVRGRWQLDPRVLPPYGADPAVRVTTGAQAAEFEPEWAQGTFQVSPHSDRMGVRLTGPAIVRRVSHDLTSGPLAPGTVQVPPDGQPIILLADAQTIGGYPILGHVASVDLPLVAQLRPHESLHFRVVALSEALAAAAARERALGLLREGLAQKLA